MLYLATRRTTQRLTRATDKFPASAAFDVIHSALTASEADRKDAIKQGNGVYAFTLKNKAGETASWHIDLKEKGAVGTGVGTKPNGKLLLRSFADDLPRSNTLLLLQSHSLYPTRTSLSSLPARPMPSDCSCLGTKG